MAEHTPGTWEWKWGGLWAKRDDDWEGASIDGYRSVGLSDPDMALIAASPDMLAALEAQAARDAHGRWNCTSCLCDDVTCSVAAELEATAIELREKALKKAKGE